MTAINPARASRGEAGFTLIEVLVALAILAVSLGVIYSAFATALRGRRAAADYEQATLLAESKLNAMGIGAGVEEGRTSGRFGDRFVWIATVAPYRENGRPEARELLRRPYVLTVTVSWMDTSSGPKSLTLRTMRLVPRSTQ